MSDAQPLRRPIVDPWAPASPVQAGALKRERPAIVDPWSSAGQDPGLTANNAQPKSASPSLFRTAGDLARLGGGGMVAGTGRAIEGIERGIADNFRESKPGRVRFLDESGQPAPMTESQRERLRAWAERNPAYEPSRVSQSLKRTGESIQEGVSPSMKQAMADSEIDGDILSPSTWTLGKDPSARGLLGHITKVGGEMAPIVAAGAIPVVGPGAAVAAATGQSYSGAYEEAHDHVLNAPADELEKSSRYRELITAGLSEGDARKVLADEAGRGAAGVAAPIGGVSGAILGGVATKPLQNAIASRAGNTFGARLLGNLAEMPLEGLQEVAESMGGRYGANQAAGLDRDLSEGTFADFALGAAAAGPAAVVHSASSGTPRGDRDSGMTAQERAELIASDTPSAAAPLALPPPGAITVDSEGNAMAPAQARERESLGLTPDVLRAQAQQEARQAVAFPDAAPGSLADAANALPQNTPTLPDGSPLPDPAGGPLSRVVGDGVATGAIPTGATTWEQAQAVIALDAADARQSAQREREMDAILRESRLPAALYDAEVARAAGVDEVARAPTAMELAMQRARSEAEAKSTRAAIVDPWAAPNTPESAKSQGANLRFAENSTSYAPGDQSYAPQDPSLDPALITQSPDSITPVRFEPLGANGLLVYGDAAEIRARLAEVGFPKKGRNRDGALRFDAADRQALEAALSQPPTRPGQDSTLPASTPDTAQGDTLAEHQAPPRAAPSPTGNLAAPITPPWMTSATGETSTPTIEQIRAAVEQQVAAQHRHNGSTGVNSPALSRAWGVPQKDVSRIARQVRANFDPARVESAPPAVEPARAAGRTQPRPAIRDPFAVPQDTVDGSTAPSSISASTAAIATHADPGQPSEPATPAVIADSAATVARHPTVPMKQARAELIERIDEAIRAAPTASPGSVADPILSKPRTVSGKREHDVTVQRTLDNGLDVPTLTLRQNTAGGWNVMHGRAKLADAADLDAARRLAGRLLAGAEWSSDDGPSGSWAFHEVKPDMVTLDVPGDGTFRVVNTRERLTEFRQKVEKQFKTPQPPRGPQPARIAMSDAERAKVMAEAETMDPQAAMPQEPTDTGNAPAARIDDFGERLEGARKFMPPSMRDELSDDQIESQPLSKVWPADSHEGIEDTHAAALMFAARQEIPAKPRRPGRIRAWAQRVRTHREMVRGVLDQPNASHAMEALAQERGMSALRGFFAKVQLLTQLPREAWSRIGRVEEYPDARHLGKNGEWVSSSHSVVEIDGRSRRFDTGKIGPDEVGQVRALLAGTEQPGRNALTARDFDVRYYRNQPRAFINRKGDSERRPLKTFEGENARKEAAEFLRNADSIPELEAAWEAVKARDNVGKRDVRSDTNRPRTGENRRGGKDVTEQMFTEAFGFRGVQFGHWVGQGRGAKDRQGMLNDAYDALLDLADVLGIPSRAISLNGSLGLSLGARGSGWASAHFERDNLVINLTKTRGAGSLAHEWFHALDNYFSRLRGSTRESGRSGDYITYKPESAWVPREYSASRGRAPMTTAQLRAVLPKYPGYDAGKTLEENASALGWQRDPNHAQGVRPEVERAFAELVEALNASPMAARAGRLDAGKSDGYWGRIIERGARSFENYTISKLAQRGWTNDFLANVRDWKAWQAIGKNNDRYPYLLPEEEAPIIGAFDNLFATIDAKEDPETGAVALFSRSAKAQEAATTGLPVENVKRIARDFMRQYRGNIPLEVKVGRTLEELYGLNAGGLGAAKGAYHPKSRVLTLAADRLSSRADVESTIRHEALGHYGLNTLAPDDKRAVLDGILTSRNQRSLASVWAQVDALYADMPESVRAEEVFAELASRERGTLGEWWDRILALLARGLRNVGLLRGDTSKAELHDLARRIAEGIRSGHAQQQTFPENDQSQFNRVRGESAGKTPSGVGELSAEQLEVLRSLGLLSPEQEADLSGRGGESSDQPTNRWGERLIPEAEARAHLRAGARGTADTVAGRAHVPVGAPGRAAGRAGEHLQLPDHAEGQPGPGARGDSDDGRATSRLLGVVRRLSESASDQLAGVPTATRYLDSRVGPFSGTETRARIKNPGTAQEALVVEVYGKEQIAAGLDEEPALAWTVNARTGELDVNGPNPDRGTFREFQKRGWADHARGQDGEIAAGWTALRNPDGGATLPIGQIIPMLADVHARYRALKKEDRVGLRWSRITGATGGPAGREASVFFSRARMPKHLSEAQRDALSQIRSFATPESLPKRARRVLGELRRELVQGVFDQFQPIQALDETAYMQARLSRGTDGVLESLFLHGTPFLRDGAFDVKADGQGLRGVLSELQGEHDLFLSWIAGHRAAQLKEQGREHLFSAQQIDALKALNRGKMPDGSDRAAAYRKALAGYNRYQKAVLDIGEQAGLFSAKSRATWESEFYIPFFRDFDAEQQNEPSPYREPGTQKVIQQLEGGRQPLGDLLTNVLENHSRILTASMRNMAADKALRAAEQAGMAAKVDTGSKDTHRVMRQGAPVHYQVADAPLVDALTMLHFNGDTNKTVQVLGAFKRALSFGVTISPGFRVRNLLRDTISAMSVADTADVTWNPLKQLVAGGRNLKHGWEAAEHGSPMFQRLLAGGGAVRFGTLNDGAQSQYARRLIATGVNPDQILDTATKLKRGVQAAFQWWQDIGDRGETVNRAVIYERAIQAGKNHLQASYEARDLIDFTAGGKWAAVRFLSQTVPFFNARLQGMYKLGRAARGDFERFSTVTGTVALASALLYLLQHDDEEYQALPDWARDAYWCINLGGTMLFIPKPFEVGALGSVVERGTELMVAGEDYQARDFTRSVTSIISDQLQMNPVPQAVRPLMEVAFNRDTFRGRPIDGMGQERLPAEDRYTARTSAAAVMAGRATNVSPQRIEHLVKGYFGWLGVQALNVADIATRPMTSLPSNPTRDMTSVSNWPVAGEFLRDASSVSSKYVERFYTMQQQNEELYAAFSAARAAGDIDRAMKLADTDAVQNRAFHNAAKRQMQEVGRSIRQVTADPSLSVREKNELLTHFQAIRNQIAHQVDQITRAR